MVYFLIGIIYAFINGYVRKIDTDGDWLLPLSWILLWPIMFLGLIVFWGKKIYANLLVKSNQKDN